MSEIKHCPKCLGDKPLSEFYSSIDGGLEPQCKKCTERMAYVEDQRRRKRKYMKKYYRENRDELLDEYRDYYRKNKKARLAYQKEYSKSKDGKEIQRKAKKRRQERKGDSKNYTRADILKRDSEDGVPICQICGYPINHGTPEIDHITPLSAGGRDIKSNVRLAHKSCNVRRRRSKFDGKDNNKEENNNE